MAEKIIGIDHQRVDNLNLLHAAKHVFGAVYPVVDVARFVGGHCAFPFFEGFAVSLDKLSGFVDLISEVCQLGEGENGLTAPFLACFLIGSACVGILSGGKIHVAEQFRDL